MRKVIFFRGIALIATVLGLSGCEEVDTSDAPVPSIATNYSARYEEASGSAQFGAYFIDNDDGNSVALSGNSDVQIDGQSMSQQLDSSSDISYFATLPVAYNLTHEFYFRDDDGNEFTNDFIFPSLVEAVAGQTLLASLENGYSVGWYASGSVSYKDSVTIALLGANGTSVTHTDNSGDLNGTVYFNPSEITQLGTTLLSLQFCHRQNTGVETEGQAENGGTLSLSSCSRILPVTLEN
jgi:hypothetical protein